MKYKILIPSIVFACDLQFLKDQLRVTHDAHDLYLESLIAAATDWAVGYTGRQINCATLQAYSRYSFCKMSYDIDRGPIIAITKIEYLNVSGALVLIPAEQYELSSDQYSGTIFLKTGFEFVNVDMVRIDAIRITYTAGYGDIETNPFPEFVCNAVALKAARLYTNPEDGVDEKVTVSENLLNSMRCPIV